MLNTWYKQWFWNDWYVVFWSSRSNSARNSSGSKRSAMRRLDRFFPPSYRGYAGISLPLDGGKRIPHMQENAIAKNKRPHHLTPQTTSPPTRPTTPTTKH